MSLFKVLLLLENYDTVWCGDAGGINSIEILYFKMTICLNTRVSTPARVVSWEDENLEESVKL